MKIIISPAKKMNVKDDILEPVGLPYFIEETKCLMDYMKTLSYEDAKAMWKCNDKIAALNYERFARMNPESRLTPAILSYEGIQYQYMAPEVFSLAQFEYVQRNLFILSGFYGALTPMEGIVPYRLEMQAKLSWEHGGDTVTDLYRYWGDALYRRVTKEDRTVLNLASKEYSRAIEAWLEPDVRYITCVFGSRAKDGTVKVKATEAKMARGEMVRYLAEHEIREPEAVRSFDRLGFRFQASLSDDTNYVFLKE